MLRTKRWEASAPRLPSQRCLSLHVADKDSIVKRSGTISVWRQSCRQVRTALHALAVKQGGPMQHVGR